MDCNKDEAIRAKEIAERKLMAKDFVGAKKFALKAENLYPALEGIQQMLATVNVYISADNKINGEADWYGILDVNPQADDETVRKQYRKLALMLHPDKNKSAGAEGAFMYISQAWSILSDKAKRADYNQKRNPKGFQKAFNSFGGPSASSQPNSTRKTNSNAKNNKCSTRKSSFSASAASQKPSSSYSVNTFWTVCHRCKTQYEYLKKYLNHNLLCPNCQKPFMAIETPPPHSSGTKTSTTWNFSQQYQNSNGQGTHRYPSETGRNNMSSPAGFNGPSSFNYTNYQWSPFSKASGTSSVAQAASTVQQAYEKVKRDREEAQARKKREERLQRKQNSKRSTGASSSGQTNTGKRQKTVDEFGRSTYRRNSTNQMCSATRRGTAESFSYNGDPLQLEIHNLLMSKIRLEIREKLKSSTSTSKIAADEVSQGNGKVTGKEDTSVINGDTDKSSLDTDEKTLRPISIAVPDPDFYNFNMDRTEGSFGENQIWAVYDNYDGMPRYYAMIHNIISLNPFRVRISWLKSKVDGALGTLNWICLGFSKTCGGFQVGRSEISNSLNSFSHKVRWRKDAEGVIHIYPRKGDVWAIYRNWCPDWNELTADEVIQKYDMVEIVEDYSDDQGVSVIPLVKVAGFKAVFHRHLNIREVRRIPRGELFRFSHQVPSHFLTVQEFPKAPKGFCRELDPAATPLELLEVISDAKEEDIFVSEEKDTDPNEAGKTMESIDREMKNFDSYSNEEKVDFKSSPEVEILEEPVICI